MQKKQKKIPSVAKQKHILNDKVALVEKDEDESKQHFKISYKYYNSNICEIDNLQVSPARKCLTKLKMLGQSNHKNLRENNIKPTLVHNSRNYKVLFSNLSDDVSLYEIDIGDASRLFYFTVGHILHVVAIKNKHIEL